MARKGKDQHVVPNGELWAVRGAGNKNVSSKHRTQQNAINAAIQNAKKEHSEVVIHGRNGRIRDKDSYGNDPCPPKDTKH